MSKTAAGITGDSYQRTTFPQVQKHISEQTMYSFQKAINLQANQCVMLNGLASDSGSSNSLILINPKMLAIIYFQEFQLLALTLHKQEGQLYIHRVQIKESSNGNILKTTTTNK